ncbi:MAG: M48 family metalloprotease [Alphaproteobacteria bacterium]|nr:M48 family metalloprotease [Alphaproteobacteria bacterium]NCQ88351.1 M48 family metalloprotease [Alphaproteobacteria bacterium]NCT05894.1 M48 family metalloprotease [Alphaproteobacteria bacterium]
MMFKKTKYFIAIVILALMTQISAAQAQTIIRDTEIEAMLSEWFKPIFEVNNMDPEQVNIILVQSNDINAFVAGGANIFFYTGLIQETSSPMELIGVMAHELGHISGGHLVRSREALESASYESILGTLVGIGAALATGEAGAVGAIGGGSNSMAQRRFLSKVRTFESSADQAAISSMERAQLNPEGLLTFLNKLEGQELVPESQQSEYVRTHPLTRSRISTIENAVSQSNYKDQAVPEKWIRQHELMKAKLLGFINPEHVMWVYDDRDQSIPAQYARTIADYRQNNIKQALSGIDRLIALEPSNPYFYEIKGQMLVDFSRVGEAIAPYEQALKLKPNAALIRIALAHALIETSQDNKANLNAAIDHLKTAAVRERRSSQVQRLLATSYGRLGQESQAKLHLAEEALLQQRFDYAKQQATSALEGLTENTSSWYRAKDILSFIETQKTS